MRRAPGGGHVIIEVQGPELSIPTPIQFQVERIMAPKRTRTFPDDASEDVVEAWIRSVEAHQDAWLLRRENEVRASFGMKPRATPVKDAPKEPEQGKVTSETLRQLREASTRLQQLTGEPVRAEVPVEEEGARRLLAELNTEVQRLSKPPEVAAGSKAVICSNARAHRTPVGLPPPVAEFSRKFFGRALCRACQDAERARK